MPDGPPLTSGSMLSPCPNLIDNSGDGQMTTQSCSTGPEEPQNRSDGPAEALTSSSVTLQASDGTIKRDVCTGIAHAAKHDIPNSFRINILYIPHRLWSCHGRAALFRDHVCLQFKK